MRNWRPVFVLVVLAILSTMASVAVAGPPPMDPRSMSGIPRPDPAVPPGTVTVRCLLGSFSRPAVGVEVTLEVRDDQGGVETFTATSAEQGRATFSGLDRLTGRLAIASVTLEGETLRSRPIPLQPQMGARVMLVTGGAAPPAAHGAGPAPRPDAAAHGGQDVPLPGKAFGLDARPRGTLVVGTLTKQGPIPGTEVTLTITPPGDAEPIVKRGISDDKGRVVFDGLVPPGIPDGSKLVAEATIAPGGEPRRSDPFEMGKTGMAVVLAEGFGEVSARQGQGPRQRPPVPGPRRDPALPVGTARIKIVDGEDAPVAGQAVQVVKKVMSGDDERLDGVTDADGIAMIEGLHAEGDALFFVGTVYDGGPYKTTFFELPDRFGVAVDLRVFPTTSDISVVKGAVQFEVRARENDLVEVLQAHEVLVTGDAAYWPGQPVEIRGADDNRSFVVLRQAEAWLSHDEDAPFATLTGPIPPDELARLSVAYLVEHDGTATIRWSPALPLMEVSVVVPEDLGLAADSASREQAPHQGPTGVELYKLGPRSAGSVVEFEITDLPTRNPIYRWLAAGLGLAMALGIAVAVALRPRTTRRADLAARRDRLLAMLDNDGAGEVPRERIVVVLDRIYRQLDALETDANDASPARGEG